MQKFIKFQSYKENWLLNASVKKKTLENIKQVLDWFNPLTPRRTLVAPFTKISILF